MTSVLLIDGEYALALTVVRCLAARKDARIHVLSSNLKSSVRYSRHVAAFLPHSACSDDALELMVREAAESTGAELLLACSTPGTEFLIRRGSRIPNTRLMHLPSLASFRSAADKWAFHLAAQSCGADSPRTWLADSAGLPEDVMFPVLLKPRFGEGGQGILRVNNTDELTAALQRHEVTSASYIVQEFAHGSDMGCNVICHEGRVLALTVQQPIRPEHSGFVSPCALRFRFLEGAAAQAINIVRHLNWTGVANFDMRIHPGGRVQVLEMNPRFWASIHGSLMAGINFVALNCSLAQLTPNPTANVRQMDYYRRSEAYLAWVRGHPSDLGCRLLDPLPDLRQIAAGLKRRIRRVTMGLAQTNLGGSFRPRPIN